jgi:hypothetical protein
MYMLIFKAKGTVKKSSQLLFSQSQKLHQANNIFNYLPELQMVPFIAASSYTTTVLGHALK